MSLFTGEQVGGSMSHGTRAEPWIEELIQNYGTGQRTTRVLARVKRVGEATGSLKELGEDPVALLLLSDGPAAIRGLLTREAWQKFLRAPHSLRVNATFTSLAGHSVLLLRYNLMAQRDVEEGKWQLMLTVHELITTFTPGAHKPCRSLQEGCSSDGEPCCLESPATAHQDRLNSLQQHLRGLLSPPSGPDLQGRPVIGRTGWDRDRIRYKDEPQFTVPSSFYLSDSQLEELERQVANPRVSVTCSPGELEEKGCPHSPDPENDSLLEFGNQEKVPINPWDMFAAEVGIRTSSDEGSGSVSPKGLPEIGDSPLCSPQPCHSQPAVVAMAPGRQMSTGSSRPAPCEKQANEGLESVGGSVQLREPSNQGSHIPAEPASSPIESPPPVRTRLLVKDASLGLDPCHSSYWARLRLCPLIRPPLPSPPVCELKTQQEEGVPLNKSKNRSKRRKRPLLTADEDEGRRRPGGVRAATEGRQPNEKEEPKILTGFDPGPSEPGTSRSRIEPRSSTRTSQPLRTHPDGTPFSYTYEPDESISQALQNLRVPDDLLRWSVKYLLQNNYTKSTK
ncbi:uncharacterized protein LOC125706067 isoform X2 [Brienomyrus brachyistius]|uniref:uncharacterized protein LOC125706067 isoform X2 n=1 Tax=Brienomyrus brachyistius TaxID=42636 RepID=UPI0020B1CC4B|nr:uncharacterized protein LOC125706067 isoform X2 [Brienomyrus brachyistius]